MFASGFKPGTVLAFYVAGVGSSSTLLVDQQGTDFHAFGNKLVVDHAPGGVIYVIGEDRRGEEREFRFELGESR